MEAAKLAVLPPLQSVVELTSAAAPPQRGAQPVTVGAASSSAGESILPAKPRFPRQKSGTSMFFMSSMRG